MIEWFSDNSDAVIGLSAIANVAILVGLAIITFFYMRSTGQMARSAKDQADASVRMADQMREQELRAYRPVLDIELVTWNMDDVGEWPDWVIVKARNIGAGAALNISIDVPADYESEFPGRPEFLGSLGAGQESASRGVSIVNGAISAVYDDLFGNSYRSTRTVFFDEAPLMSAYSLSLDKLFVESLR